MDRVAYRVARDALFGDGLGALARSSALTPRDERVDQSQRLQESEQQRLFLARLATSKQDVSEPFVQLPLGSRVNGGKTRHRYEAEQFGALFGENSALY